MRPLFLSFPRTPTWAGLSLKPQLPSHPIWGAREHQHGQSMGSVGSPWHRSSPPPLPAQQPLLATTVPSLACSGEHASHLAWPSLITDH